MKKRCVVYAKDIARITGKSARYGQKALKKIRDFFNKTKDEFITVEDFSKFSSIPIPRIMEYLD
ncbi:hypothetical protein KI659_06150 [Litoribacter alkaliphilus]|uniref:Uncharacterized protein n=1 Tax=Litoribacter ruber TaxID=702568 RepID=A0AAP2G419_9BACT|nr:hypothetical protein [Litoribacter alkaliphilus]MBS9523596.1 hypothetical protein [Litoribacter alkaliphilus]